MALQTHTGYGTPDITSGTQIYDFSPLILASLRQEEAVIAHIPVGAPVQDTTWYIEEENLLSNQLTQSGTFATAATTLNVTAGQGVRVRVGAILQAITSQASAAVQQDNGEQVQVTAIATDALTVTRAYGLTADPGLTMPASTIWKVISQTLPEGSDIQTDLSQKRLITNFVTQIFERTVNITRNQLKRRMQGVQDEFSYQLDQVTIQLRRELNDTVIFGTQNPAPAATFPATTVGDNRTMMGMLYALQKKGSPAAKATFDNTAEALTPLVFNNMAYAVAKKGGHATAAFLGGKQARVVEGFGQDLIRIVPNETVRQGFTTLYRTDMGVVVTLVVDGNFEDGAAGTMTLTDLERVALRPFVDAEMFVLTAPSFKDGDAARVISEWGAEWRNAIQSLDAHAIHTALTIPS